MVSVTLPEMGESVTEGSIVEWRRKVGDYVTEGDALVDVTTDKVDVEVPATASGTITQIHAGAGDTVSVGALLAEIDTSKVQGNGAAPAASRRTDPPTPREPKIVEVTLARDGRVGDRRLDRRTAKEGRRFRRRGRYAARRDDRQSRRRSSGSRLRRDRRDSREGRRHGRRRREARRHRRQRRRCVVRCRGLRVAGKTRRRRSSGRTRRNAREPTSLHRRTRSAWRANSTSISRSCAAPARTV